MIAIITPSDVFTQISINFANQVDSPENRQKLAGRTKCARQSGTENSNTPIISIIININMGVAWIFAARVHCILSSNWDDLL